MIRPLAIAVAAVVAVVTVARQSGDVPEIPAAAGQVSTELFPNAPVGPDWHAYADYRWGVRPGGDGSYDKIPFWREPTYDLDNGSHVVDYGSDSPKGKPRPWPAQLSSLLADDGVPGGGKALAIRFPKGFGGGAAPARIFRHPRYDGEGLSWPAGDNTGYLYIGLHFKFSAGFSLNGNVGQKLVYANSNAPGNKGLNHIPLNLRLADGAPGFYPAYEPQHPFGLYRVPAVRANNVNDGRWHLLEVLQEPNTPGVKNGRIRIYIDGRQAGSWNDALLFDRGQTPSLNSLSLNPIFGGGTNPVPAEQQLLLGPLRVMGH